MGLSYLKKDFSPILLNAQGLIEAWVQNCRVKISTCENLSLELAQIGVELSEKVAWVQDCRVKIFSCENLILELAQIGVELPEKGLQSHFTKCPGPH